jgi:DNA-binding NtrC family response regulator
MMEERGEFMPYEDLVHNFERTLLRQALFQHDWNLSATARALGLAESSLRYKLNKLGVIRSEAQD